MKKERRPASNGQNVSDDFDETDHKALTTYYDLQNSQSIQISDEELGRISIRDLNQQLTVARVSAETAKQVRERRRLLKNRDYSQVGRLRRTEAHDDLESVKVSLSVEIQRLKSENMELREEIEYKRKRRLELERQLLLKSTNNKRPKLE